MAQMQNLINIDGELELTWLASAGELSTYINHLQYLPYLQGQPAMNQTIGNRHLQYVLRR